MVKKIEDLMLALNKAFVKANPHELREITNDSVSNFAITQKKVWFSMALIAYVLSKIVQKPRYEKLASKGSKFADSVSDSLQKAAAFCKLGKEMECQTELENVIQQIHSMEAYDPRFISDQVVKGKVKIAAMLYAQGLSLDMAASLTGAERNEVLNYTGKTMMPDRMGRTLSAKDRMAYARQLVKKVGKNSSKK